MNHYIHDLLDKAAERLPEKTAVITNEGTISYAALADQSKRLATYFRERGVRRGNRILILLPNSIPVLVAAFAASRIGAVFVIVNYATKPYNVEYIVRDSDPALVLTNRARNGDFPTVAGMPRVVLEDDYEAALQTVPAPSACPAITIDPCFFIYTSGSTSKPKAVVEGHRNVIFATWAIQDRLQYRESDIVGNFLPLAFDFGLYQAFLTFQVGATFALGQEGDVGPLLLKKMRAWNVTGMPIVPSLADVVIRLASRTQDPLPSLRFLTNSGAQLPRSYVASLKRLLPSCQVYVMFGLTECKRVSILLPEEYERKIESVGRPLAQTECVIIGPDGTPVPPGTHGELVVRGPNVMLGYWCSPEQMALRYRTWGPRAEVALFTGDVCSMDSEGYLYFHGRNDDIYKQRGCRVSAIEVEGAACEIEGVRQAAIIDTQSERGATLVIVGDASEETVLHGLRARLEDFKVPAKIVRHQGELPVTPNRKVDKKAIAALFLDSPGT